MTRAELMRAVRAQGAQIAPHVVEYMAQAGHLSPPPALDASLRRVFTDEHVAQVVEHARRSAGRRAARAGA